MQLNQATSIKTALSLATCALLNGASLAATADTTELKASNTIYAEDNRVIVDESIFSIKHEIDDDEFLKGTVIVDVMSGASPNGLPPIRSIESYTSPSGSVLTPRADRDQTYQFRDTRTAVALEYQKPVNRLLTTALGFSYSSEYDYQSIGISNNWRKDTEDRLTTFSAGVAANYDVIDSVGGVPEGLSSIKDNSSSNSQTKTEADLLMGVTQVLSRYALLQANYVANIKNGYLSDPYKLIAFLDDANQDRAPRHDDPYFHEKRPGFRLSHIGYINLIQNIKSHVLKLTYRYFNDDWGIESNTAEARFQLKLKDKTSLQFKYRYYIQNAAYFYHYYLIDGEQQNDDSRDIVNHPTDLKYVSADYRLGNLQSHTVGMKLSHTFTAKNARLDFRVDRIVSSDKSNRFESVRSWVAQIAAKINF